jgi:two-component system, response regulator, stage 0 sporulation protein F
MKKILIADDDSSILNLYGEEFSDEGYNVILATNGKEAVEKFRKENPDVVLMDIHMPVMNGIESMIVILGTSHETPIILNSAFPQYKKDCLTCGAEAFVVKSSDLTELKEKVQEVLRKRDEGGILVSSMIPK